MNSIVPNFLVRQRGRPSRRPTPEERVRALLAFPFSPVVREHTIQELLNDPITRPFVHAAPTRNSKIETRN